MSKKYLKTIAFFCGVLGVGILIYVMYPIVAYQIYSQSKYPKLLSPVVEKTPLPQYLEGDLDYTKASNWFLPKDEKPDFGTSKIAYYTISIPSLKIEDATVAIGGEDLSQSLIQYPGTALPGKTGNAVIFGHSILPQFFDPKNYISIFSTLPRIKKNDLIDVDYDGIYYQYEVVDLFEVAPTDIQVLEQDSSDSFLTLVTCTPPGDPRRPKRLIVRARIIPQNENYNILH